MRSLLWPALVVALVASGCKQADNSGAADPCTGNHGGCSNNATCTTVDGVPHCACKPGYLGDGLECALDACASGPCGAHATCTSTGGQAQCACTDGFVMEGSACVVDACAVDHGGCDAHAACTSSAGQAQCACRAGYQGDGRTCVPQGCTTPDAGCVEASCGDGTVTSPEACDDGNGRTGDGCNPSCQVEPGWTCAGSPSLCHTTCGDGLLRGAEACDDGNVNPGDGCDQCAVEPGFACGGEPSTCARTCGDGVLTGVEGCDDGNAARGDGCASCQVERGWQCSGAPSVCSPVCGDGLLRGSESCDDGNTGTGDGCDGSCRAESGWQCSGEPSRCNGECGDGVIRGAETCDDHGTAALDGCSATCQRESGWQCSGEPSVCVSVCGDGYLRGAEACDDGNTVSGDGCSASCQVEPHFQCSGEPTHCFPVCGDGVLGPGEECDDGNSTNGDGCHATCRLESGWRCTGTPSVCAPRCGDGLKRGAEECDDRNTVPGDGCSATCRLEPGWSCYAWEPSLCFTLCGDRLRRGTEACDDGNLSAGDGCDGTCHLEPGWTCSTATPNRCSGVCGDGLLRGAEQCDDGNVNPGDGCSATCTLEPGFSCTGTPSVCAPFGVTLTSPAHGTFTTAGSVAVTGTVTRLNPVSAAVTVNGVDVTLDDSGNFSTTVTLDPQQLFNPIRASVTDLQYGSRAHDRVVVIAGDSVPSGTASPQSVALRVTDYGLDRLEQVAAQRTQTGFNLASLIPTNTVLINDECFIDLGWAGCGGRATVKVNGAPASFGSFTLGLDSRPNAVGVNVAMTDIHVNVYLQGSGAVPSCDIAIHADGAFFSGEFGLEPNSVDPSLLGVRQFGNLAVSFTGFTTSYAGSCDLPVVRDIIDAFLPNVQTRVVNGTENYLNDPDGGGVLDGPIASGLHAALDGMSITGPVGRGLGVMFDAPLFQVAEDFTGVTLGANARFSTALGTGDGQCEPAPGAPTLAASLALHQAFPALGPTTPAGNLDYGLGIGITADGFNQLLKSKTECGLMVTSLTRLDLTGAGEVPLTAGALAMFVPEFGALPASTPLRMDVRPSLAPVVTGTAGPHGELTTLKLAHLLLTVVRADATQRVLLRGAVDVTLGLDLLFAGGGLGFRVTPPEAADVQVALLANPLGASESTLETLVLPAVVAQLIPSLASSLGSFPLPEFLGLALEGVEVPHAGALAFFVNLCPSGCQAPSCTDQVRNGDETDVDCGGSCPACARGRVCGVDADCVDHLCVNAICGCPSESFTFLVNAMDNAVDGASDTWAGGIQTKGSAACGVTVSTPAGPVDQPNDPWAVTEFTGFTTCFGAGGVAGDGCHAPTCETPADTDVCVERRPTCTLGMGSGTSTATFTVVCAN